MSKIERKEALAALDELAAASDVLMVARGDLGVEIGLANVPRAQREILAAGRRHGVPVIVATQMLESMIENPTPTRAEVSDVAGAVHDGADAVMLSGETAVGAWPVEAVRAMAEIAREAEVPDAGTVPEDVSRPPAGDFAAVVARTAAGMARDAHAAAMVVYTESGRTARLVSKNPLSIPVLAFTSTERVRQKLTLLRDVTSFRVRRGAQRRGADPRRRRRPLPAARPRRGGRRRDLGHGAGGRRDEHRARETHPRLTAVSRRPAARRRGAGGGIAGGSGTPRGAISRSSPSISSGS